MTEATSGRPRLLLEIVVFCVGMASLGAEIAAARLMAPWFGASTIVWANTIATVLVALSIGYAIGGRLADRNPTMAGLARCVVAAAALLALVPFVSGPFLRQSTKAFSELSGGLFVGSLLGVGVLIAVPVLLLGMVSPYAVRLKVDQVADAGRVAGRLYAIGTIGSLTGTFLAALLLIPLVGTRRTFLIFALTLALTVVPALGRRWFVAAAVAAVIAVLIAVPVGSTKTTTTAGKVIWERETEYQYARVIQQSDGRRLLELNEGQAVHSVYTKGEWLTGGYWDEMLVLPFAGANRPKRVAILGSAAGTTARAMAHYFPDIHIDAVEIDPDVTAVGRELFDLHGKSITTHAADARPWLQAQTGTYDAILVDAYRQPYIPFYLTTREFFDVVKERLNPGGVVAINVGHPAESDKLEKVLSATLRASFGQDRVSRDPAEDTNSMLLATTSAADPAEQLRTAEMPGEVRSVAAATADRIQPGLTGGPVYTDDRAPVEWLVDASLAQVAE
ncbi:MAG: Spermine synthase [Marmoricola sp.]|nr:Spermine synthase [Marmoricola sp.]